MGKFSDIEISRLAKELVTKAIPDTDAKLSELKERAVKIKRKYKE